MVVVGELEFVEVTESNKEMYVFSQHWIATISTGSLYLRPLQITQLMKQDSYVRFLKSDSYKACVMAEMEGKPLPCPEPSTGGDTNNNNHSSPAPPTPSDRWRKVSYNVTTQQ